MSFIRIALFLLLSISFELSAQFPIGHKTIIWEDAQRNNRKVKAELYYPALEKGKKKKSAKGSLPLIVFAHGFTMNYKAYSNITDELVPKGFMLLYLRTESGFSPSHSDYAADIAFLARSFEEKSHKWKDHWNGQIVAMGHSMGGGGSAVALSIWDGFDAYIALNPSAHAGALDAARKFKGPVLIFSASEDRVTPPWEDHQPLYDAFASSCKAMITVKGGGHCRFNDWHAFCEFGEFASQNEMSISREEQQKQLFNYLIPWLNKYIKKEYAGNHKDLFIENSDRVSIQTQCPN